MANLKIQKNYVEARPAFIEGNLQVTPKIVEKPVAVEGVLVVTKAPPKQPINLLTKEKEKIKLTREQKDAIITPIKDILGQLSAGIETFEKQQARRKMLKKWLKVEKDEEDDEEIIIAPSTGY